MVHGILWREAVETVLICEAKTRMKGREGKYKDDCIVVIGSYISVFNLLNVNLISDF